MTVVAQNDSKSVQKSEVDTKRELLKRTICKGATDDELDLFAQVCKQTGLNPFMRQVYMVGRKERQTDGSYSNKMTIQTSIDGFRLVAERTGRYSPGKEPTFNYDKESKILSATSYVKKMTTDGTWHEVAATAFYDEYVQCFKDGKPSQFWERMPHVMLSKCAEALALRKAFPAELSGVYTQEEMSQAAPAEPKFLSEEQEAKLDALVLEINDEDYMSKLCEFLKIETIFELNPKDYERTVRSLEKKIKSVKEGSNESSAVA